MSPCGIHNLQGTIYKEEVLNFNQLLMSFALSMIITIKVGLKAPYSNQCTVVNWNEFKSQLIHFMTNLFNCNTEIFLFERQQCIEVDLLK